MRQVIRVLAFAALVANTACASVEHMRELREIQDGFSDIAERENNSTIAAAAPTIDKLAESARDRDGADMLKGSTNEPDKYYRKYFEISQRLAALENRAGQKLRSDGLLGTSQTLHVLANWRATFYGQYLRLDETAGAISTTPAPKAMSSVWDEAKATAKRIQNNKWQVYPRDEFLLSAMEPLVMHDIAYLNAIKANPTSPPTPAAKALIEDFAKAEQKLAGLSFQPQLEYYRVLARYIMLRNAYVLFQHIGLDHATFTRDSVRNLDTFKARVNKFRKEFHETANGKNHQALRDIGINGVAPRNKLDVFTGGGLPDVQ